MPITFSNAPGMNPSTIDFKLGTVTVARGSTNELQEIVHLGDPQSSIGIAVVKAAAPVSTEFGLVVRIASGPSSAADLPVQISGNSTVVIQSGNSSVSISAVASGVRMNIGSTAADNAVTATLVQPSTGFPVNVVNGSLTLNDTNALAAGQSSLAAAVTFMHAFDGTTNWNRVQGSSQSPSTNAYAINVRQVVGGFQTYVNSTAFTTSTAVTVVSSNAANCAYVYGYSITSTEQAANNLVFLDGNTVRWGLKLQANSSGLTGANWGVSPPAYIFKNSTGSPLTLNISGSSGQSYMVSVAYWVST